MPQGFIIHSRDLTNHECLLGSHADPIFYDIGQEPIGQEPIGQEPIGQEPIGQEPIGQEPIGQFLPPLLISC